MLPYTTLTLSWHLRTLTQSLLFFLTSTWDRYLRYLTVVVGIYSHETVMYKYACINRYYINRVWIRIGSDFDHLVLLRADEFPCRGPFGNGQIFFLVADSHIDQPRLAISGESKGRENWRSKRSMSLQHWFWGSDLPDLWVNQMNQSSCIRHQTTLSSGDF